MFRPLRFLSLALLAAAKLPAVEAPPVQISVQCEWIRLPHASANSLIRQHLKGTGHTRLHEEVSAMLKAKTATRLDVQSLLSSAGLRTKVEGVIEKASATQFDPPQFPQTLSIDGDWPFHLATPACAGSFTFRNLGREVELEVALTKGGLPVQLKLAASWSEHLTDIPYGIGISAFSQPEFFHARVLTELRCASGVWQLAGLFTPPPDKKAGAGSAPLPADRVLLFVRATAPGLKPDGKSGPDNERATHSVLAEWIEADAGLIAGLLEAAPDLTSAAGLRAALEDPLAAGTAMLMETAFVSVPSRAVAKIISVRSFPFPAEVDPAQPPQTLTVTNRTPAGAAVPGGGVQAPLMTPSFFNAYAHRESGTVMEVHCAPHGDGALTELELKADISALAGGDVFGHGVAEVPQPRFQNLHCSTVFTILPGVPALAGLLDPLLPPGQSQPAVRPRKILFFVTVLP